MGLLSYWPLRAKARLKAAAPALTHGNSAPKNTEKSTAPILLRGTPAALFHA